MFKLLVLSLCLLLTFVASSQPQIRKDSLLKLDMLIERYLATIRQVPDRNEKQSGFYFNLKADNIQALSDSMQRWLINEYLSIFDTLIRKNKESDFRGQDQRIRTAEAKIDFLISYCLLSNIFPTRGFMEDLLQINPCILLEREIPLSYRVKHPYPFIFKRRDVKRMHNNSVRNFQQYNVVSMNLPDREERSYQVYTGGRNRVHVADGSLSQDFQLYHFPNSDIMWKVAFCIIGYNNRQMEHFTVSYHGRRTANYQSVSGASFGETQITPGDFYLSVTEDYSTVPVKIIDSVIHVKQIIARAPLDPFKNIRHYDRNKKISKENIFIIYIKLMK